MLEITRKAFGGLGQSVKIPDKDMRLAVISVDLLTGDAVLERWDRGKIVEKIFAGKRFTQDDLQAAVSSGVAEHVKHRPDWKISDYPELDAWLKYEQVPSSTEHPDA